MIFEHSFVGATLPIRNHVVAVEDEVGSIITPSKLIFIDVSCELHFKILFVFLVIYNFR